AGLGCIAGVSKESTAVQSCWTWVKRAFILPIRMIQTADELHLKEKVKKPIEKLLHVLNASNKKLIIQYRSL
ncbi:hypothetical protein, partial [Enterococcus faecalis]